VVAASLNLGKQLLLSGFAQKIVCPAAAQDVDLVYDHPGTCALARQSKGAGQSAPAAGARKEVEHPHLSGTADRDKVR
jgi:hypothetical protein